MSPKRTDGPRLARKQAPLSKATTALRRRLAIAAAGGVLVLAAIATLTATSATAAGSPSGSVRAATAATGTLGPLTPLGHLNPTGPLGALGPEDIPIPPAPQLANLNSAAAGKAVDGIQCLGSEQTLFHIHAHLTIFVNGTPRQVPYGIGITDPQAQNTPQGPFVGGGQCFYWLHTHAADGIIHIESPVRRIFTLGNFFDVWGQPLTPGRAGPAIGPVTALYNGKLYHGNPRNIPLYPHAQIQLEVGKPLVAPVVVKFPPGL